MAHKPHPERCHPHLVREAIRRADGDKKATWSKYIQLHWQHTGNLAPGCDAVDFYAAHDQILAGGDPQGDNSDAGMRVSNHR